jgi:predicted amidohydrolase
MEEIVVAAAQIACRQGDVAGNVELHLRAVETARAQDVALLVFPELSVTDYISEPDIGALACPADAPHLLRIAQAAGEMAVSVGFIERGADGRAYNAQALFADGRCLGVHRKLNLPTYGRLQEGRHYAEGSRLEAAPWRDWRVATLVCADTWNPALPWLAALQGADLLLVPVASSRDAVDAEFDNPGGWTLNLRHTALTYALPIVMANHCGCRGGLDFWGGSTVIDAFGREVARLGAEPGMAVARLRQEDVALARARLPTIRDANPALVRAELDRILQSEVSRALSRV